MCLRAVLPVIGCHDVSDDVSEYDDVDEFQHNANGRLQRQHGDECRVNRTLRNPASAAAKSTVFLIKLAIG